MTKFSDLFELDTSNPALRSKDVLNAAYAAISGAEGLGSESAAKPGLYARLLDFVVQGAKTDDNPANAGILARTKKVSDTDIQYLKREFLPGEDGDHPTYKWSINSTDLSKLHKETIKEKRDVYEEIYALHKMGSITTADFNTIEDANNSIDELIKKILEIKYPNPDGSKALSDYLNELQAQESKSKEDLIKYIERSDKIERDAMLSLVVENRVSNLRKIDFKSMLNALGLPESIADNNPWKDEHKTITTYLQGLSSGLVGKLMAPKVLYVEPNNDLVLAVQERQKNLKAHFGILKLKGARDEGFKPERETQRLVNLLTLEFQQLLKQLPLKVKSEFDNWNTALFHVGNVRLYVPESLKVMQAMWEGGAITSNDTTDIDINRPLFIRSNNKITFVNTLPDTFALVDRVAPHVVYNYTYPLTAAAGSRNQIKIDFGKRTCEPALTSRGKLGFAQRLANELFPAIPDEKQDKTPEEKRIEMNQANMRGSMDWQALYTVKNGGTPISCIIWYKSGGGGHGIGRADDLEEVEYLWEYCGSLLNHQALAKHLGLEADKEIKRFQTEIVVSGKSFKEDLHTIPAGWKNRVLTHHGTTATDQKGSSSASSSAAPPPPLCQYVEVNTPFYFTDLKDPGPFPNPTSFEAESGLHEEPVRGKAAETGRKFHFRYYREMDQNCKVKKPNTSKVKNKPRTLDTTSSNYIPLNLPITLSQPENFHKFHTTKKNRKYVRNLGARLTSNPNLRSDAGSIMSEISDFLKAGITKSWTDTKLPATDFVKSIAEATPVPDTTSTGGPSSAPPVAPPDRRMLKDWRQLKSTMQHLLPTDQEWCHLHGHGDGGKEEVGNFVSGSNHCNTEQLAIELGQRLTTHIDQEYTYMLRSTAYLLDDNSMQVSPPSPPGTPGSPDSPKGVAGPATSPSTPDAARHLPPVSGDPEIKTVLNDDYVLQYNRVNAPIAAFIHYRVFRCKIASHEYEKIVDHVFEGQGEFFDQNQYRILNRTVEFVLKGEERTEEWLKEAKDADKDMDADADAGDDRGADDDPGPGGDKSSDADAGPGDDMDSDSGVGPLPGDDTDFETDGNGSDSDDDGDSGSQGGSGKRGAGSLGSARNPPRKRKKPLPTPVGTTTTTPPSTG